MKTILITLSLQAKDSISSVSNATATSIDMIPTDKQNVPDLIWRLLDHLFAFPGRVLKLKLLIFKVMMHRGRGFCKKKMATWSTWTVLRYMKTQNS